MPHCLHRSTNKHKHHIQLAKPRIDAGCLPTNTNKVAHWKVCGRCKCHSRFGYAFFVASLKFFWNKYHHSMQCEHTPSQRGGARPVVRHLGREAESVLSLALKCEIYPWNILNTVANQNLKYATWNRNGNKSAARIAFVFVGWIEA